MSATINEIIGFRAFYNGTSLQAPVAPAKMDAFFKNIVTAGESLIISFLRDGKSLAEVKAILKGQMDLMEDGLCRTQKEADIGKVGDQSAWMAAATAGTEMDGDGDLNVILWFINIACLLKLKVIENDNNNGWLFPLFPKQI
jgi:hypothetical protein